MNFKDIQYFLSLTDTQSYTKTAERFHISQPSVSYAVKRLERELGTTLFLRSQSHRRIQLTDSGRLFRTFAQLVVGEYAHVLKGIARLNHKQLVIGLPNMVASSYMTRLYLAFQDLKIADQIAYVNDSSLKLLKKILRGTLDMALISTVSPIAAPELACETLSARAFEIAVARDHPLAGRKSITLSEAADYPFLLFSPESRHYQVFQKIMARNHLHPTIAHQNRDITVLHQMAAEHLGIAFLAEIDPLTRANGRLTYIPIADSDIPELTICAVYPKAAIPRPEILAVFRNLFGTAKK
ncbi:LysR family transcriptional regulator [Pseudoramibacter faecis]|uniref:LysR family transcriptional regulator n=1 Tax=Pseudoramibacter faecis TaxID=3108534 RepID=UPI002E7A2957|nr:LysR family transcriptional regulator [Pseudoramibacter sp. HA2172]